MEMKSIISTFVCVQMVDNYQNMQIVTFLRCHLEFADLKITDEPEKI